MAYTCEHACVGACVGACKRAHARECGLALEQAHVSVGGWMGGCTTERTTACDRATSGHGAGRVFAQM
eukprot:334660-Chlamydomonas_euryale.AAC.1